MDYKILKEEVVFDGYFKMLKANVKHETLDGGVIEIERLAFHRGNSAAILLYEKETNQVILTRQFRYPVTKNGNSWLFEIPAGAVEENEQPVECIIRETLEETGYAIYKPEEIFTFYNSPGASTEKSTIYFAEVSMADKKGKGGGLAAENEDIATVKVDANQIQNWLKEKKIVDAKTIIALQWFLLNKKLERI